MQHNLAFILPGFQQFLLKRMLVFSHKMVLIEIEVGLSCVTMRERRRTQKGICSYNIVYNFLIQLLSLKSVVFAVHFLKAFWHGNKAFPKGSSQSEIIPPVVVFHLPYSKYKGVKICFYSCCTRMVRVAFVLGLCGSGVARVSLVSLVSHSCHIRVGRVALESLVSGTVDVNQTRL